VDLVIPTRALNVIHTTELAVVGSLIESVAILALPVVGVVIQPEV
jgi:hypothetical protein